MRKGLILTVIVASLAMMVVGCGSGVSEDKPIAEVKQEAANLDIAQLQSMVDKYKKAIEAKQPEIQALQAKLKAIPITQMLGADAKEIKTEIAGVVASVRALTDRMKIYAAEVSKKS